MHVRDAVAAIVALMGCEAAHGEVVNIGGSEEISIADLAQQVISLAGQGTIEVVPYEQVYPGTGFEDLRRRVPCVAKAQRLIGFAPAYDLSAIVADCLAHAGENS